MADNAHSVDRKAEARRRLALALEQPTWKNLSDVLYDAAHDGMDWPDGEGGFVEEEYGYDCDDLAAVLWPFLQALRQVSASGAVYDRR